MPRDLDLARAAVQAPGWRWMAGMLAGSGARILGPADNGCYDSHGSVCHQWYDDHERNGVNLCERHEGRAVVDSADRIAHGV